MQNVIELLKTNVQINLSTHPNAKLEVRELTWATDVSSFNPPFDIIIAADVIYQQMDVPALVKTLIDLSNENTLILIAYETHDPDTPQRFEVKVKEHFRINKIPKHDLDEVYNKSSISVVQLQKIGHKSVINR